MDENESKWMAGMMTYYGEAKVMELLRKLAAQEIQFRVGHTLIQTLARRRRAPHRRSRLCQRRRSSEKGRCAHRLGRRRPDHRSHFRSRISKRRAASQRRPLVHRLPTFARRPGNSSRCRLLRAAHRCCLAAHEASPAENESGSAADDAWRPATTNTSRPTEK